MDMASHLVNQEPIQVLEAPETRDEEQRFVEPEMVTISDSIFNLRLEPSPPVASIQQPLEHEIPQSDKDTRHPGEVVNQLSLFQQMQALKVLVEREIEPVPPSLVSTVSISMPPCLD